MGSVNLYGGIRCCQMFAYWQCEIVWMYTLLSEVVLWAGRIHIDEYSAVRGLSLILR